MQHMLQVICCQALTWSRRGSTCFPILPETRPSSMAQTSSASALGAMLSLSKLIWCTCITTAELLHACSPALLCLRMWYLHRIARTNSTELAGYHLAVGHDIAKNPVCCQFWRCACLQSSIKVP